MRVSLFTADRDPHYALPLTSALVDGGVEVDFVAGDSLEKAAEVQREGVRYHNLRGAQGQRAGVLTKVFRLLGYYLRLVAYGFQAKSKLFHFLWLNRFVYFDRTLLNLYYKLLGKKLVFTAHNVNAGERDGNDSVWNRLSLKIMYRLMDHVFVHTQRMQEELVRDFGVRPERVTIIPYGINNAVPRTELGRAAARGALQLGETEKVVLFFGNIVPYKGLEHLVSAVALLKKQGERVKVLVAGRIKEDPDYWADIEATIQRESLEDQVLAKLDFIPDDEIEMYFKAADVLALPYNHIFQSGVLFLSYNYGLPVIATDVGSLREDIVEGETGFLCRPRDPGDLASVLKTFFESPLYENLESSRERIAERASREHSWEEVGRRTQGVYAKLLGGDGGELA